MSVAVLIWCRTAWRYLDQGEFSLGLCCGRHYKQLILFVIYQVVGSENPRVVGSIPTLATRTNKGLGESLTPSLLPVVHGLSTS